MKKALLITLVLSCFGITCARAQFYGVKVNALELAAGTLNAGAEVAVAKQWSLDISGYWNPLKTDRFSSRLWYLQPGVRYWLYEHFVGHFFAAHAAYGRYNIGNDRLYHKGWAAGLGVSYGYTWILSKQWNLTAEGGFGFYYLRRAKHYYEYDDWSPVCIPQYRNIVVAPSKLEIAFTYLF